MVFGHIVASGEVIDRLFIDLKVEIGVPRKYLPLSR